MEIILDTVWKLSLEQDGKSLYFPNDQPRLCQFRGHQHTLDWLRGNLCRMSKLLSSPLKGPSLRSFWPLRSSDVAKFWQKHFAAERPLPGALHLASEVGRSLDLLPYPLKLVYRVSIAQHRFNRSRNLKSGAFFSCLRAVLIIFCVCVGGSTVMATNLGKIGKK